MRLTGIGQCESYYDLQKSNTRQDESISDMGLISKQETKQEEKSTLGKCSLEPSVENNEQYLISDARYLEGDLFRVKCNEIERAISDMEKDQVLQQYNYFVSSEENSLGDTGYEPMPLENFEL